LPGPGERSKNACHCQPRDVPDRAEARRLRARLQRRVRQAVSRFSLVEPGDRVLVAFSGGKDSFTMLDMLLWWRRHCGQRFDLLAVHVDHGFGGPLAGQVEEFLATQPISYRVVTTSIAAIIEGKLQPGKRACSLCSRLRRGVLYRLAPELGCNKIALGHHADDLIETLLLNLMYTGQIKSMPPLLVSDDGRNRVIRPLVLVDERDTGAWAAWRGYLPRCCNCPACGQRDNPQRRVVKRLVEQLQQRCPRVRANILRAHGRVVPELLLGCENGKLPA